LNIKKQNLIIFLLLLITVFFLKYEFKDEGNYKLPIKNIFYIDEEVFNMYNKHYDIEKKRNIYWGFSKKISIDEVVNEKSFDADEIIVSQKEGDNVLCIESSCFRLIGIHHNAKVSSVTLYNKDFKEKVKVFTANSMLKNSIIVGKIESHKILFKDLNSSREWQFEIFDVNDTKYKPKEIDK